MAAQVVYENAPATAERASGTLFAQKAFWVSRRTPFRTTYIERISSNGGSLTELEGAADYKIADHIKIKFAPPGSVSYKFIDACLWAGALVDPTPHLILSDRHESRPIGSTQRPAKGVRTPFTAEDDRILLQWLENSQSFIRGNRIYQELEEKHPHHTWQSWRARYLKSLQPRQPAPVAPTVPADLAGQLSESREVEVPSEPAVNGRREQSIERDNVRIAGNGNIKDPNIVGVKDEVLQETASGSAPTMNGQDVREDSETLRAEAPYPPISGIAEEDESEGEGEEGDVDVKEENAIDVNDDNDEEAEENEAVDEDDRQSAASFVTDDFENLLHASKSIIGMEPSRIEEAWATFAEEDSLGRTGEQWRSYWETIVLPEYLRGKQQRRIDGVPSSDVERDDAESEEESEGEESNATGSSSRSDSVPRTPKTADADGIEILADDGKRHISTPIRPKPSTSDKRKREDDSEESGSTQLIGERSPLKKRRVVPNNVESDVQRVVDDSEGEDPSTQARGLQTAPTGHVGSQVEIVDLSQLSDGDNESSGSSDAFEESTLYETAPPQPQTRDAEAESSEYNEEDYVNTQGDIDAQLISEMSSAVQYASPPRRSQRAEPSSSRSAPALSSQAHAEPPPLSDDEDGSESDSDLSEIVVMRRAPDAGFAPAAFQTSPPGSPQQAGPSRLPAFSSPSSRARGKQPQQPRASSRTEHSSPSTKQRTSEPVADIPAWVRVQQARGVSMAHIQRAVKAASGELGVAERVLRALARRDGEVPPNERGIWTDHDDAHLRRGAETNLIALVKKHGKKLLEERREFLLAFEGSDDE